MGDFSQFVLPGERGIFPAEILGGPAFLSLPPLLFSFHSCALNEFLFLPLFISKL